MLRRPLGKPGQSKRVCPGKASSQAPATALIPPAPAASVELCRSSPCFYPPLRSTLSHGFEAHDPTTLPGGGGGGHAMRCGLQEAGGDPPPPPARTACGPVVDRCPPAVNDSFSFR